MKRSFNAAHLNPDKLKRLKTLMALLVKAKAFQDASVRVVHHYTQPEWNDFTLEPLACGEQSYMHGHGGIIQRGDHIVLQNGSDADCYRVDEIDYDAKPSDFWVALLQPCSELSDRRFWMQPGHERRQAPYPQSCPICSYVDKKSV